MKLSRAIEELTEITNYTTHRPSAVKVAAIELSIEALKWRQHDEKEVFHWALIPLPGETPE